MLCFQNDKCTTAGIFLVSILIMVALFVWVTGKATLGAGGPHTTEDHYLHKDCNCSFRIAAKEYSIFALEMSEWQVSFTWKAESSAFISTIELIIPLKWNFLSRFLCTVLLNTEFGSLVT